MIKLDGLKGSMFPVSRNESVPQLATLPEGAPRAAGGIWDPGPLGDSGHGVIVHD